MDQKSVEAAAAHVEYVEMIEAATTLDDLRPVLLLMAKDIAATIKAQTTQRAAILGNSVELLDRIRELEARVSEIGYWQRNM